MRQALAFSAIALLSVAITAQAKDLAPEDLVQRSIERHAVEAVIWGMPAVNAELMFQAMKDAGRTSTRSSTGRGPSVGRTRRSHRTPTRSTSCPSIDTKGVGPMVLEIPPADEASITGSIDDAWQVALEDVGPAGVDKGKGGKYLILPPGYKGKCRRAIFLCPRRPIPVSLYCAPISRAAAMPTSPRPSHMASA